MNYICPIFRFATQTFNGGYKRKTNTDKRWTRGGSRGRVQGVRTPTPPEMTCSFLIQLVFCKKKTMWFIGVEVEQGTSAPPPKKNPGSALWTAAVNPFISLLHPPSPWCEWCVKVDHTTGVYVPYSFRTVVWVKCKCYETGPTFRSLQRQYFLLSYFK